MTTPAKSGNAVTEFLAKRWLTLVLIALAVLFIAQNRNQVQIDLFWVSVEAPLWLVMALLFLVGLIAGAATFKRRVKAKGGGA